MLKTEKNGNIGPILFYLNLYAVGLTVTMSIVERLNMRLAKNCIALNIFVRQSLCVNT